MVSWRRGRAGATPSGTELLLESSKGNRTSSSAVGKQKPQETKEPKGEKKPQGKPRLFE